MKLEYSREIFEKRKKDSNIKYHENPSSGSRVAPHGLTEMTKLVIGYSHILRTRLKSVMLF